MADSVKKIPKPPQMRGLLHSQIKRHIFGAVVATAISGILCKIYLNDERKRAFAEFYKNYDVEKEFHRMRKKGLFDSCDPDDDEE